MNTNPNTHIHSDNLRHGKYCSYCAITEIIGVILCSYLLSTDGIPINRDIPSVESRYSSVLLIAIAIIAILLY